MVKITIEGESLEEIRKEILILIKEIQDLKEPKNEEKPREN